MYNIINNLCLKGLILNNNKLKKSNKNFKYLNPFINEERDYYSNGQRVNKFYIRNNPRVIELNGGMIIEVLKNKQYDYLVNNKLVAQRVGCNIRLLKEFIKVNLQPLDYETQNKIKVKMELLNKIKKEKIKENQFLDFSL